MRKQHIFLLTLALVVFSGCFEMVEEVTFTDKQKGTYLLTLNCSQSRDKLNGLLKLDTFMGMHLPKTYEVSGELSRAADVLRRTPGIHKVEYHSDFRQYLFTISFAFDSTEALNRGLNAAIRSASAKQGLHSTLIFNAHAQGFERLNTPGDTLIKQSVAGKDLSGLLKNATYTSVYRFKRSIASVSNSKARISKNGNAVMLRHAIPDLLKDFTLFTNHIQFK